jgi:hypothetical protein
MTLYLSCKHNEKCRFKKYDVILSKRKEKNHNQIKNLNINFLETLQIQENFMSRDIYRVAY